MIKVNNVVKRFGSFTALDGVNINVNKGSVYGLVGPNGAGKTTIIKNIMGIYRPDSGEIKIDGENVYENTDVKSRMVYVSDDLYFFPGYSIKDMASYYRGIYPNWSDERFLKMKDIFKIDVKRNIRRLSKGMQKQTAFWLGLAANPDIMILDEPVDGLDPVMRKNVWNLMLADVAEREMTVLVSSHNLRELEDVCDHVGIMNKGKVVIEQALDDVKGNTHKVQTAFKGEFPAELLASLEILKHERTGSLDMLILRGSYEEIENRIKEFSPLILDVVPLSLEEIFIYELGGMGYELEIVD
ncbi:MAG: ABC transporter ATP-binding protein [Oscillospiraceae bacterium]|nr:ABC transporter ATP-binding protein [Oscillospiraceae bacterium]